MIIMAAMIGVFVFLLLQLTNTPTGARQGRLCLLFSTAFAIFASVLSAGATVASVRASRQSASSQRRARDEQNRREEISNQRNRVRQVREARAARAESQAIAISQGVGGSSAAQGSLSSIQSQLGSNLGFGLNQGTSVRRQSGFLQDAADASGRANTFGAVSKLSSQAGTLFGPQGALEIEGKF